MHSRNNKQTIYKFCCSFQQSCASSNDCTVQSQQQDQQAADDSGSEETDSHVRTTSLTAVSQQPVINVDQSEAEQWLKARIGSQYTIK